MSNPGEVVGAIKKDRKPRTRLSLKDKVAALDAKVAKAEQRILVLKQRRANLIANARQDLAEVETVAEYRP